jgi:hypothetical protein
MRSPCLSLTDFKWQAGRHPQVTEKASDQAALEPVNVADLANMAKLAELAVFSET